MASEIRRRGAFILFEGADRSGKSTQCNKLFSYLSEKGLLVKKIGFPDRQSPTTGALLNSYLQGTVAVDPHVSHLLFSANRWEKADEMVELLQSGYTLVVDRYAYSGIAYSVAKKSISFDWACHPDMGLPAPDLIFYFSLHFDELQKREGFGDEIFDTREFQTSVQSVYSHLREQDSLPERWKTIQANRAIDEIHSEVRSIADATINSIDSQPIQKFKILPTI